MPVCCPSPVAEADRFDPTSFIWSALGARLFLKYRVDAIFATKAGPFWLMPVRDLLSFWVFVSSLSGETVHWRGNRLSVESGGVITPTQSVEAAQ